MASFHNYALLVVVALPVIVVLAMNAWAFFHGERDTLLIPGVTRYPTAGVALAEEPAIETVPGAPRAVPTTPDRPRERLAA